MGEKQSKVTSTTQENYGITINGGITTKFEWTLPDLLRLTSYKVGECITLDFIASGTDKYSFSLCLYPHGFNERTGNYVSVWLKKQSAKELAIRFTCAIVDVKGKKLCTKSVRQNLALESVLGWAAFCNRRVFLDEKNETLKKDSLTLKGKVKIFGSSAIPNAEIEDDPVHATSLSKMSNSFQQLLMERGFADFTLNVGEETLHVHKAILSARSTVFKDLFRLFPFHKDSNRIDIPSVSLEVMKIVLRYIYTGRLGYLNIPNAMKVYCAADMYGMVILRDICSSTLSNNLLTVNVIEVLMLAYSHSDFELQESCLTYIDKNLREIKGRPEWIDLMRNYPKLADRALFFHDTKNTTDEVIEKCQLERKRSIRKK